MGPTLLEVNSAYPFPGMVILGVHWLSGLAGKVHSINVSDQDTIGHSFSQINTDPSVVPNAVPVIVKLLPPLQLENKIP